MDKSREAIERREMRIRELEDLVHEEVRSEESTEDSDECEVEEGGRPRVVAIIEGERTWYVQEGRRKRWDERPEEVKELRAARLRFDL